MYFENTFTANSGSLKMPQGRVDHILQSATSFWWVTWQGQQQGFFDIFVITLLIGKWHLLKRYPVGYKVKIRSHLTKHLYVTTCVACQRARVLCWSKTCTCILLLPHLSPTLTTHKCVIDTWNYGPQQHLVRLLLRPFKLWWSIGDMTAHFRQFTEASLFLVGDVEKWFSPRWRRPK